MRPRSFRRASQPRRLVGVVALLIAFAFLLTGCDRATGGGWIPSLSPTGGHATFAFSAKCKNSTIDGVPTAVFYQGQFDFDDHAFNPLVRVHGVVSPDEFLGDCFVDLISRRGRIEGMEPGTGGTQVI